MSSSNPPLAVPSTARWKSSPSSAVSLPPISSLHNYYYASSSFSSSPPRSSSPPKTPTSSRSRDHVAFALSSPTAASDMGLYGYALRQDPSFYSKRPDSDLSCFYSCTKFATSSYQAPPLDRLSMYAQLNDDVSTLPPHISPLKYLRPPRNVSPDTDDENDGDRSGYSFITEDTRSTFFMVSAERGRWRTDPVQRKFQQQVHISKSVPTTASPPPLIRKHRTLSEPALPQRSEDLAVDTQASEESEDQPMESEVHTPASEVADTPPSLATGRDSSIGLDCLLTPLSPLPPSSPLLSPITSYASPKIESLPSPITSPLIASSPLTWSSPSPIADILDLPSEVLTELVASDDTVQPEETAREQITLDDVVQCPDSNDESVPTHPTTPHVSSSPEPAPLPTLIEAKSSYDRCDISHSRSSASLLFSNAVVEPSIGTPEATFVSGSSTVELAVDVKREKEVLGPRENTVDEANKPDNANFVKSKMSMPSKKKRKKEDQPDKAPSTKRRRLDTGRSHRETKSVAKTTAMASDSKVQASVPELEPGHDAQVNQKRQRRKSNADCPPELVVDHEASSRATIPEQPSKESSDSKDLDNEIRGMLIESMALSRASSLPVSSLYKAVTKTRPALVAQRCEQEWMKVFRRVLESGVAGCGSGVFGKVESSGKDDCDRPLEPQWFYVPELDEDQERATLIRSMMPRPGKRSETKKYKQYYYRPLEKMSRWDPEDFL
ncbi:hypothetical protein AMATHDRAFT_68074 [Amanita thiersii Skay4041]|uniref:Uncharacterized protein n=1 Tax=Amanita thiersii Skay4041 TaxID=703135 RepID=A0A2A9NHL8_9AGAR|nr:hypothetical protein AMATHDRAFT_68074 [Amanita thiersii Skay4041]